MEKINVKNLVLGDMGAIETVEVRDNLADVELPEDLKVKDVAGRLKLTRLDETILVIGEFFAKAELICDRCLCLFEKEIELDLEREYEIDRTNASEENLYVDKYLNIDITEAVREELILAVPMKRICQENCKGICPNCGKNLNDKECNCKKEL